MPEHASSAMSSAGTRSPNDTQEGQSDSGRQSRTGAREYALEILDELERLIEALRAGCESATDPEMLSRRREHVQRAIALREKLLMEIEKLPSVGDDEPP